jgi:hypothetical protein
MTLCLVSPLRFAATHTSAGVCFSLPVVGASAPTTGTYTTGDSAHEGSPFGAAFCCPVIPTGAPRSLRSSADESQQHFHHERASTATRSTSAVEVTSSTLERTTP